MRPYFAVREFSRDNSGFSPEYSIRDRGNIQDPTWNESSAMYTGFDTLRGTPSPIATALVDELFRGVDMLQQISEADFMTTDGTSGSVGQHFRHNLNFVEAVLNGARLGRIDYTKRVRELRVEADREYAVQRFAGVIARLSRSTAGDALKEVSVVSEVDDSIDHRSSVGRELEFAHSHTVHHHALIAEKLRSMGAEVDVMFGVAPSTKRYWDGQQTSVWLSLDGSHAS